MVLHRNVSVYQKLFRQIIFCIKTLMQINFMRVLNLAELTVINGLHDGIGVYDI